MSIIMGAMMGLGQGMQAEGKQLGDQALAQMQSDLALQKAEALAQFSNDLKNAPLNRFSGIAQQMAQTPVPVAASPVTKLSGADPNSDYTEQNGTPTSGLTGDISTLLQRVNNMPDSDPNKAPLLAQIQRQQSSDQAAAQQAVTGQTRSMTTDEALNAALQRTKLSDPEAYLAGQGIQSGDFMKIGEGDTIIDKRTGNVMFQNSSKADRQEAHDDRVDARQDKRLEAMLEAMHGKNSDTPLGKNIALLKGMGYSESDIKDFVFNRKQSSPEDIAAKLMANDLTGKMTPGQAAQKAIDLQSSLNQLRSQASSSNTTSNPFSTLPPGAKQVGTSGGKPVYETQDGKRFIQQ